MKKRRGSRANDELDVVKRKINLQQYNLLIRHTSSRDILELVET